MTHAEFNLRSEKIQRKIREMDSRKRVFQGAIAKEKRRLEEKDKKKEDRKRREKAFFEWSEKNVSK